jgi:hypothetical protein
MARSPGIPAFALLGGVALALGGCGLAETTAATATGAAAEAQQAQEAQRTEQRVQQQVEAAQAQAKARLDAADPSNAAGATADQ